MHESVENLYTLKKKESKVRNKLVPWIDFSSTSATFNKNIDEATNTFNKDKGYHSGDILDPKDTTINRLSNANQGKSFAERLVTFLLFCYSDKFCFYRIFLTFSHRHGGFQSPL